MRFSLIMLDFLKNATGKDKAFRAFLANVLKAFHCLCHDPFISKLYSYGLNRSSLNLIQDYLSNREKKTKGKFLVPGKIFSVFPQGSILGPVLDSLTYWFST